MLTSPGLIASDHGLRYDRLLASVLCVTEVVPVVEPPRTWHTQKNQNHRKNNTFKEKGQAIMLRISAAEGISYAGASQLARAAYL